MSTTESSKGRVIATAAIGNLVEWYDFALYAYSASAISNAFFPEGNDTAAILSTLAVFGVSFLLRPLGGLVLGRYGDKVGRRNVLSISVLGMGVCTVLMGLIPTYAAIGLLAPVLLVVTRLGQGFFSGGEYTGASTFLVEHAPTNRRDCGPVSRWRRGHCRSLSRALSSWRSRRCRIRPTTRSVGVFRS